MEAKKFFDRKNGVMTFGRSLRAWREGEELSQEDLAKMTKLTKTAISRFENGHDFPASDTIKKLGKALNADTRMWAVYILRDIAEKRGIEDLVQITAREA